MTADPSPARRLPAHERRASIIDAATTVFAERGFAAATTAQIARAAAVNEALIFRHFGSKQGLYIECIDAAWLAVREACADAMNAEPDERLRWRRMGSTFLQLASRNPAPAQLWARALAENTGLSEVDGHVALLMSDVHDFAASVLRDSQQAGGIAPGHDARVEAWIAIAIGLLGVVAARLGASAASDFEQVLAAHRHWLSTPTGG